MAPKKHFPFIRPGELFCTPFLKFELICDVTNQDSLSIFFILLTIAIIKNFLIQYLITIISPKIK